MICHGSLGYGAVKALKALDALQYDQLRRRALSIRDKMPATHAELVTSDKDEWSWGMHGDLLMDGDELEAWSEVGIDVTVKRVKGVASNAPNPVQAIYQVSVANVGLMQVQLVEVLEDCCTYDLQSYLDKGWRLIAVCPPNDARRPTYVVGHTEREGHH